MQKLVLAAAAVLAAAMIPQPAVAADTIYVVRHMQKVAGDDPPLSVEGAANAALLRDMLGDKHVTAVFATPTLRARQTAEPLAKLMGITVTDYDPRDTAALAAKIAATPGAVLIVGHSNTVPDLVALFGGERPADLTDEDYGSLFIVSGEGKISRVELHPAH